MMPFLKIFIYFVISERFPPLLSVDCVVICAFKKKILGFNHKLKPNSMQCITFSITYMELPVTATQWRKLICIDNNDSKKKISTFKRATSRSQQLV